VNRSYFGEQRNAAPNCRSERLPERRCRRADGSLPQLPEELTDDGVPRDDGAASRRANSRTWRSETVRSRA